MKVYVVTVEETYEGTVMSTEYPKAFSTIEKAKADFKKFVDDEKEMDEDWIIDDDTDTHFEAYKEDDYTENHTEAFVIELDVL